MKMRRICTAAAVAALVIGGVQVVTPAPAAAVAGLVRILGTATPDDSAADKGALVRCPTTAPRIVGGGIIVNDHGQRQAFARYLLPIKNLGPSGVDAWEVGTTVPPGFAGTYSVQAVAMCARDAGVPGHEVVHSRPTTPSSSSIQENLAGCSSGKRVLGFGGSVLEGGREVGLQVVRSDGARGISRAYAHEDANGYSGQWRMLASVICMTTNDARPPSGAAVPGFTASTLCSNNPNTFVHGPGGGAWDGTGLIHQIVPSAGRKQNSVTITRGSTAAFTSTICVP